MTFSTLKKKIVGMRILRTDIFLFNEEKIMFYKAIALSAFSLFAFCGAIAEEAETVALPETQEELLADCGCKKGKGTCVACSSCRGKMMACELELEEVEATLARVLTPEEEEMVENDIDFDDLMACGKCGCGCQVIDEVVQDNEAV